METQSMAVFFDNKNFNCIAYFCYVGESGAGWPRSRLADWLFENDRSDKWRPFYEIKCVSER